MKLEMDECSAWTIIACVVSVVILTGALGGCYIDGQIQQKAIAAGMVQEVPPGGRTTYIWTKPHP